MASAACTRCHVEFHGSVCPSCGGMSNVITLEPVSGTKTVPTTDLERELRSVTRFLDQAKFELDILRDQIDNGWASVKAAMTHAETKVERLKVEIDKLYSEK